MKQKSGPDKDIRRQLKASPARRACPSPAGGALSYGCGSWHLGALACRNDAGRGSTSSGRTFAFR